MKEFSAQTITNGASTEIIREGYSLYENGITNWLNSKNIISLKERVINYYDIAPWQRTDVETYSAIFEFTSTSMTKRVVIKAIVTMFPEKSLLD